MKRCPQGHYYDETKHSACPACGTGINIKPTTPIGRTDPIGGVNPQPVPNNNQGETNKTRKINDPISPTPGSNVERKTVAIVAKKAGFDPVVGWLVCINGPDKGRDYRIRSEKNFIGRSEKMNICIQNDETISRENHAIVSYNPKNKSFKIHPGDGRGLVYLNDDDVTIPVELKSHDIIELGQTKLMFVPLCGEQFEWIKD